MNTTCDTDASCCNTDGGASCCWNVTCCNATCCKRDDPTGNCCDDAPCLPKDHIWAPSSNWQWKCHCPREYSGEYCEEALKPLCLHDGNATAIEDNIEVPDRRKRSINITSIDDLPQDTDEERNFVAALRRFELIYGDPLQYYYNISVDWQFALESLVEGQLDTSATAEDDSVGSTYTWSCSCTSDWFGPNCEYYYYPYFECLNGGTPVLTEAGGTREWNCTCAEDFTGPFCEGVSSTGACFNGGIPQLNATSGTWGCDCTALTNFQGDLCDEDVNECLSAVSPCGDNTFCVNSHGSFHCVCNDTVKYKLASDMLSCTDVDECTERYNGGCTMNCHNTVGSHYCTCETGFELADDGHTCIDINECLNGKCGSISNTTCMNTIGSYYCACDYGYLPQDGVTEENGRTCTDINECQQPKPSMYGALCTHTCTNTDGSYECSCPTGMNLFNDQHVCLDINECNNTPNPCSGTCHNTPGSYECRCPLGYSVQADGSCDNINECDNLNGYCSHNCQDNDGSYTCSCRTGWTLNDDQLTCQDIDECLSGATNPCVSSCENTYGTYFCRCDEGYQLLSTGACTDINECEIAGACDENSNCVNNVGSFSCKCALGFELDEDGETCILKGNLTVSIRLDAEFDSSLKDPNSALYKSYCDDLKAQVQTTEFNRYAAQQNINDIVCEFSNGSIVAFLNMQFDSPLSIEAQSQITYTVQTDVANLNNQLVLGGRPRSVQGIPQLVSVQGAEIAEADITDVCYLYNLLGFCKSGSSCQESEEHIPVCRCADGFFGTQCDQTLDTQSEITTPVLFLIAGLAALGAIVGISCFCNWCLLRKLRDVELVVYSPVYTDDVEAIPPERHRRRRHHRHRHHRHHHRRQIADSQISIAEPIPEAGRPGAKRLNYGWW